MTVIHITRQAGLFGEDEATCKFSYDPDAVAIVRQIPGRHWHADAKVWTFHDEEVVVAAEMFADAGHTVFIDGELWEAAASARSGSPLGEFYAALPDHLADAVYGALIRVLHPDVGGDHVLAQQLNTARDARTGRNQRHRRYG